MNKLEISILIIVLIIFSQVLKIDRKLTCIYNQIDIIPMLIKPELFKDKEELGQVYEKVNSVCDPTYIFFGVPHKVLK